MDALRLILAPYGDKGDLAQLCAAACVSRAWRNAAKEPKLWVSLTNFRHLKSTRYKLRFGEVTDEVLAELVKRAGDGRELHLNELDVTSCKLVSARGVVAALAGAGLEGKLKALKVADTLSSAKDSVVIANLRRFLAKNCRNSGLDVRNYLPCAARIKDAGGRKKRCSRLCADVFCVECDIAICGWCSDIGPFQPYHYNGPVFCKHVCADCGDLSYDDVGLMACPGCDLEGGRCLLCYNCYAWCNGCETAQCLRHCVHSMVICTDKAYCARCSANQEFVFCTMCYDCWNCDNGHLPHFIKTAEDWLDELEKEGSMDEALEARLEHLSSVLGQDANDPGLICQRCVNTRLKR